MGTSTMLPLAVLARDLTRLDEPRFVEHYGRRFLVLQRSQMLEPAGSGDAAERVAVLLDRAPDDVVLGRGDDCQVRLKDGSVSKKHARLTRAGDAWTIEDLGSHNGTAIESVATIPHLPAPLPKETATVMLGLVPVWVVDVKGLSRLASAAGS